MDEWGWVGVIDGWGGVGTGRDWDEGRVGGGRWGRVTGADRKLKTTSPLVYINQMEAPRDIHSGISLSMR